MHTRWYEMNQFLHHPLLSLRRYTRVTSMCKSAHIILLKQKKSHQKSQGSEFVEFWCLRRLKRLLDWRSRAKAAKKRQQANAVFSNLSLQISGVFLRQDRLSSGFHHRLKKSKAQLGHTKSFSFFLVSPVWAVLHVQFSMKKKSHLLKYRCVSVSNS